MYARDLMFWLHERLGDVDTFEQSQTRFEQLRAYNRLPMGRENAGVRLTYNQIANAVFGFCHRLPGYAGHAAIVFADLRPVGGTAASVNGCATLQDVVASFIEGTDETINFVRLVLSISRDFAGDEYGAKFYHRLGNKTQCISFVSKYATRLSEPGSEIDYKHEQLDQMTGWEKSFGPSFFDSLSRNVKLSRHLDRPFKTHWLEYETEEEKAARFTSFIKFLESACGRKRALAKRANQN
jgi:hypothetical protein